jgi:hypothetical protein
LEVLCQRKVGNKIDIPNSVFKEAKIQFWKPYTFKAKAVTDFYQGDGSTVVEDQTTVSWIPFVPDVKIVSEEFVTFEQVLRVTVESNGINSD